VVCLSLVLLFTFKFTFGYDNFKTQLGISESDQTGVSFIKDNLKDDDIKNKYKDVEQNGLKLYNFEDRMLYSLIKYYDIDSSVFDNRTLQKTLNRYLWKISPTSDKILGYGHDVMPICTWVETDIHTIFYCYGIVGFILIILIPIGFVVLNGFKCLINLKKLTNSKMILGVGFLLGVFIIYYVGYTMQFAQTVFYFMLLLVLSNEIFRSTGTNKKEKDYLFMINDLNIGGAEVGMIDVVNELASQGKSVDIVLLRKRGPLLSKLNDKLLTFICAKIRKNYAKTTNGVRYAVFRIVKRIWL